MLEQHAILQFNQWREQQNGRLIQNWWQCVSGSSDPCFFDHRTAAAGGPEPTGRTMSFNSSGWHVTHACFLVHSPHAESFFRGVARSRKVWMNQRFAAVGTWYPVRASLGGVNSPSLVSPDCGLILQVRFVALRVSASTFLLLLDWSEDARMCEGYKQLRNRTWKEVSASIHQDGSWYGKCRERIWNSRRLTMHRQRCNVK